MAEKNKRKLGSKGEDIAAEHLLGCGYEILSRNFRFGRHGEVDIVAIESGYICFIEVKSRSNMNFGLPCEAVNKTKQERLKRLAFFYLERNGYLERNVRFDIVEVYFEHGKASVNIIKNAF